MTVISKFKKIDISCSDYVHPWTNSCAEATAGLFLHSVLSSLRIYISAYVLSLLLKGKIPTKEDIQYSILGVIQSTAFLSCHAFGYSLTLCSLRKIMGHFNFLTVSFIPSFISSLVAILVERPSRRSILSLYVTNVASETLFRMAVWRKWLKPIPYGDVFIFSASSAVLLYFFRGNHNKKDPIYSFLRFFVGPCEENGYKDRVENKKPVSYKYFDNYINCLGPHLLCPHPYNCFGYCVQGGIKLFGIGCCLQLCLKILLQMNRVIGEPNVMLYTIFNLDMLRLGVFFAGFGGSFRMISCLLRHALKKDCDLHALPAGFFAGTFFIFFRDNTAALYAMWKTIQIIYNKGVNKGCLPPFPGASILFHALATAILFHVAIIEPHNLRPSYWRFLTNISGNRINKMNRCCLDVFGLESSKSLEIAEERM